MVQLQHNQQRSTIQINPKRLEQALDALAQIGQLPNGGVSRVAFSADDLLARRQVQAWMVEAGMRVRIDTAGNMIGYYAGQNPELGALATGSHIDTVPVGGRYDGCLGVLAGIEVVRTLKERSLRLRHAIEVIVFTDEERSVIGCKAMAGEVSEDPSAYARLDGTPIQQCLKTIGGNWRQIHQAQRQPGEIAAFVELHVEQGGVLEHFGKPIGNVTGIVGQYRLAVKIIGCPNHAGTTPMNMRQDALVAAAQVILAVQRIATETPGEQVATVGYLNVLPNATNTIAGQVDLRIDLRDLSQDNLAAIVEVIQQTLTEIAAATGTKISMQQMLHILPTLADAEIMQVITEACQDLGLDSMVLPSRAGHDAQEIGRFAAMGMIFVPSRSGISHSGEEYTAPAECAQGANVLLQTFLKLDQS
jgi:beta-ureidopropionase / N-carbamoyl-L-amino-acid hydrolase